MDRKMCLQLRCIRFVCVCVLVCVSRWCLPRHLAKCTHTHAAHDDAPAQHAGGARFDGGGVASPLAVQTSSRRPPASPAPSNTRARKLLLCRRLHYNHRFFGVVVVDGIAQTLYTHIEFEQTYNAVARNVVEPGTSVCVHWRMYSGWHKWWAQPKCCSANAANINIGQKLQKRDDFFPIFKKNKNIKNIINAGAGIFVSDVNINRSVLLLSIF